MGFTDVEATACFNHLLNIFITPDIVLKGDFPTLMTLWMNLFLVMPPFVPLVSSLEIVESNFMIALAKAKASLLHAKAPTGGLPLNSIKPLLTSTVSGETSAILPERLLVLGYTGGDFIAPSLSPLNKFLSHFRIKYLISLIDSEFTLLRGAVIFSLSALLRTSQA